MSASTTWKQALFNQLMYPESGRLSDGDRYVKRLFATGRVQATEDDGRVHILCPFEHESGDYAVGSTSYFPANCQGREFGFFHCLHASCHGRKTGAFIEALAIADTPAEAAQFRHEMDTVRRRRGLPPHSWGDRAKADVNDFNVLDEVRHA